MSGIQPDPYIGVPPEGFIEIRCRPCGGTVMAPVGPDFWHPASGGLARSKHGVHCRCGNVITVIGLGDIAAGLEWVKEIERDWPFDLPD